METCPGHKGWHPSTTEECVQDLKASMSAPEVPCPKCGLMRKPTRIPTALDELEAALER